MNYVSIFSYERSSSWRFRKYIFLIGKIKIKYNYPEIIYSFFQFRPSVRPNAGFLRQLKTLAQESSRIRWSSGVSVWSFACHCEMCTSVVYMWFKQWKTNVLMSNITYSCPGLFFFLQTVMLFSGLGTNSSGMFTWRTLPTRRAI